MIPPPGSPIGEVLELAWRRSPSVHNSQPWKLRALDDSRAEVTADLSRQLSDIDPDGRQLHLSVGALLTTALWAGRALGHAVIASPPGVEVVRPTAKDAAAAHAL